MEGYGWIPTIIVGGLAGWIAEKVMKFDTGLIMNIILGVVGSVIVNYLAARLLNMEFAGSLLATLVSGVIGACLLIYAYKVAQSRNA